MNLKKSKKEKESLKKLIDKSVFSSANHKKIIKQAAQESSEDQRILLSKYKKLYLNS